MDEHLEELIKLAWKASPSEAEYYLSKYVMRIQNRLNEITKNIDYYNADNDEDGIQYNKLLNLEESVEKKLNQFKFVLSFLRGS